MAKTCLIVGAGLAGLAAGRLLQDAGWSVVLLDKGRAPGGRMSTVHFAGATFDDGAQFFTVRSERFHSAVKDWLARGIAREWYTEDGHTRYIGTDGMNRIPQHLAKDLDVRVSEHVEKVLPGWTIATRTGEFQADALIATAPMEQTLELLRFDVATEMRMKLHQIRFEPCFALMALLDAPSLVPAPGYVRPAEGPISWMADNQQKSISELPAVTIHARPDFTNAHWDAPRDEVAALLAQAAGEWIPGDIVERQVHRWTYSMPAHTLPEGFIRIDQPGRLVFAGDAFAGPRVEGAWLSGVAAAESLLAG